MLEFLANNKEWVFSGIGVFALTIIGKIIFSPSTEDQPSGNIINNNINIDSSQINNNSQPSPKGELTAKLDKAKATISILFVDDDSRFKVVKILQRSGWVKSETIKDIDSLDSNLVSNTDIFFIDIQGVGHSLGFKDEGLGLALALKDKYPHKKVVIYSAETKGERFHAALRKADTFLAKNAEPYEFQQIVEDYAIELLGS